MSGSQDKSLPPPFPVFVDMTGRRRRVVRIIGWALGGLVTLYLCLLVVSLLSSPGLLPLSLPGVGRLLPDGAAPTIIDATRKVTKPGELINGGTPTAPSTTRSTTHRSVHASPNAHAIKSATPTPSPSATPDASSSHTTGKPTTSPGANGHGSPSTHPTSHGQGRTPRPKTT
jgi:hypothetical protein